MFTFLLSLVVSVNAINYEQMALDPELIKAVNNANTTWVAGLSARFQDMTILEAQKLMGTELTTDHNLPQLTYDHIADADVPASFDSRTQWPNFIHPIRDQQQCGSCWAFAGTEALSDRFAIASNGSINVILSPEDLVSCDHTDMGCQGGNLANAWTFMQNEGVVNDTCFPYTAGSGVAAPCPTNGKCVDGEKWTTYKAKNVGAITGVQNIKKAIMTNGPVEAGFQVHKSFMSYTSGVYQHHWWQFWDPVEGGHAIKIIGWGTEKKTPYWIVANSWGPSWGEDGFFKIRQDKNNCQINSMVFAGEAAV